MKYYRTLTALICAILLLSTCNSPHDQSAVPPAGPERRFSLGGAPVELIVGLSAETVALTDFLIITIRVEHTEGVQAEAPYLSDDVYAPLLLTQPPQENITWSEAKGRIIKTWVYRFEPMRSGEFKLNPFRLFFRLESEKTGTLDRWPVYKIETAPIPYRITAVEISDQSDIRAAKGMILPPYNFLPPVLTAVVIGLGLLLGWLFLRFRSRQQVPESPRAAAIDYLAESLKLLDELEEKDYISKREHEKLHVALSSIMRYFIENSFGLKALEQTTEEFIREIQYSPHFSTEQQSILRQFLELADLVKFATYDPGSTASREAVKTVRYFIESTRTAQ